MTQEASVKWFVEKGNQKEGPFTLDEIQELLNDGKLEPTSRLTSSAAPDKSVILLDLLKSRSDPLYTLFEALQAARDRKSKHEVVPPPADLTPAPPFRIEPRTWFVIALGVIITLLILVLRNALDVSKRTFDDPESRIQTLSPGSPPLETPDARPSGPNSSLSELQTQLGLPKKTLSAPPRAIPSPSRTSPSGLPSPESSSGSSGPEEPAPAPSDSNAQGSSLENPEPEGADQARDGNPQPDPPEGTEGQPQYSE